MARADGGQPWMLSAEEVNEAAEIAEAMRRSGRVALLADLQAKRLPPRQYLEALRQFPKEPQ